MSRRRHFHNFILLLGSLVFALLCGEIGARIYVGVTGGAPEGAKSLFDRVGMIDLRGHSECGGKGPEVIPHPYFAFVKNPYHPCNQRGAWTNRHGFLNPEEFPEVGESEHFDILILGSLWRIWCYYIDIFSVIY